MSRTLICAIQIGTSRICAAAAWRDQIGNYEIAAIETEQSAGCIRKGCVVDVNATAAHIKNIVLKLSNRVKSEECRGIEAAYVGINGISMHSMPHDSSLILEDGNAVNSEKTTMLRQQSMRATTVGYDILGIEPKGYTLDDIDCINPIGRTGYKLVAHHQLIIAQQRLRLGVRAAMEHAGVRLVGIVATPLAVSQILSADEKQRGCCLIDLGHSLTTVIVYANGMLQHLATIPLGGNAVTKDIAVAKGISKEEAEKQKIMMNDLDIVSQCRYEEIAANIAHQIELSGYKDRLAAGCVLTGGASNQQALVALLGEQLGINRIMVRGYNGIIFGTSDRKPQLSSLTTMLTYCSADCESKPVAKPIQEGKPTPIKPVEPKPEPAPVKNDNENKKDKQPNVQPQSGKGSIFGKIFRDLFSGIDENDREA